MMVTRIRIMKYTNMKRLTYILLTVLAGAFVSSCENDAAKVMISGNPVAPELTAPAAPGGMEFVKADADNNIDYTWSAADFGFQASVTYTVEIALTGTFEGSAILVTTAGDLEGSAKVADINAILLSWELPVDVSATIKCRVKASVNDDVEPVYSAAVDYTVTPYETLIDYPLAYVPGAYQGWSPGDENGRLFSYAFNSVFENTIRVIDLPDNPTADVEFKVTTNPNWDGPNYGSIPLVLSGSNYSGTLDPNNGDNLKVAPGVYEFVVDFNDLSIALTKTDDWGVIGAAIPPFDWSVDADMWYNGQRQMWEITGDFKAGEFKFRANDAWDLNLGDSGADGSLEEGGDNIVLPADGNYTIRLDRINNTYQVLAN